MSAPLVSAGLGHVRTGENTAQNAVQIAAENAVNVDTGRDNKVYLSIWKDNEKTVVIEFKPLLETPEFEPFFDGIEIVFVDIQYKPVSLWQQREAERRKNVSS